MGDSILFFGGIMFLLLAYFSYFDRDSLWGLYSRDKSWRKRNPERTEQWDANARRNGIFYFALGLIFFILSFVLKR